MFSPNFRNFIFAPNFGIKQIRDDERKYNQRLVQNSTFFFFFAPNFAVTQI